MANKIDILISAKDQASKALEGVRGSLESVSDSAKRNQETFKKMAGFGTAAFAAIGIGVKKLVSQASDLEETTQKFNVVYRDLGDAANNAAKDIAAGYGLSQKASKQFLADLGDVTSGFGLSQEASLDYATQVTKLGVDLASFANIAGGSEEAIDRLNKGFLGEHENLKALGIIINDTMLKKQLLADGTEKLTGLELEQAKIQARMTIAMSQSANAIGDFERSKSSLANQTRILQANMEDLNTNLGNAFLPIITQITTALIPVIQNFAKWAGENPELLKTIVIVTAGITGTIAVLGTLGLVIPTIIAGVSALGVALTFLALNPIGMVITAIGAGIAIGILIVKNWEDIKTKATELGGKLMELYENYKILLLPIAPLIEAGKLLYNNFDSIKYIIMLLGESLVELWGKFIEMKDIIISSGEDMYNGYMGWIGALKDAMFAKVGEVFNYVQNKVAQMKALLSSVGGAISSAASSVGNAISSGVQNISGARANGGRVLAGKTYRVGERGSELFTPQSSGKITSNEDMGGAQTINVNMGGVTVNNRADADYLAETVIQKLTSMKKLQSIGVV